MNSNRITKQMEYMKKHDDCVICGSNVVMFTIKNNERIMNNMTNHKEILTLDEYIKNPNSWIANHPTLCFKKTAVLKVGNYNINNLLPCEDFDLELRLLKHYGKIYNSRKLSVL